MSHKHYQGKARVVKLIADKIDSEQRKSLVRETDII